MCTSSKTISAIINVRLNSTRIDRKMMKSFSGGTTLLDLVLRKFSQLDIDKYVAFCPSEKEIADACQKYGEWYSFIHRDEASVVKGTANQRVSFKHYDDIPTTHILWINPCAPFLRVETVRRALDFFMENDFPTMTSVKNLKNIVFDESFSPINTESLSVSTQGNSPLYEMAHLFHIFDKQSFKNKGFFWDYSQNNPHCYVIDSPKECMDIDEPFDFELCEALC